jgi:hypothetical protein
LLICDELGLCLLLQLLVLLLVLLLLVLLLLVLLLLVLLLLLLLQLLLHWLVPRSLVGGAKSVVKLERQIVTNKPYRFQ